MNLERLTKIVIANENLCRQTGRTTALIEACRKINGVFICHSEEMASILRRRYPDVEIVSASYRRLIGNTKPIIIDHLLLYQIFSIFSEVNIISQSSKTKLLDLIKQIKEELIRREISKGKLYIGVRKKEVFEELLLELVL